VSKLDFTYPLRMWLHKPADIIEMLAFCMSHILKVTARLLNSNMQIIKL